MAIFCFSRANAMVGHRYTDDVAICKAFSHRKAVKKFEKFYSDIQQHEVKRVRKLLKVRILTDY